MLLVFHTLQTRSWSDYIFWAYLWNDKRKDPVKNQRQFFSLGLERTEVLDEDRRRFARKKTIKPVYRLHNEETFCMLAGASGPEHTSPNEENTMGQKLNSLSDLSVL